MTKSILTLANTQNLRNYNAKWFYFWGNISQHFLEILEQAIFRILEKKSVICNTCTMMYVAVFNLYYTMEVALKLNYLIFHPCSINL